MHPNGRSRNVCEGVHRLGHGACPGVGLDRETDTESVRGIHVELWPTAHRFARGHRLRVQVCGAAAPRFAPGTTVVEQEIFHDPLQPSAIILPVAGLTGSLDPLSEEFTRCAYQRWLAWPPPSTQTSRAPGICSASRVLHSSPNKSGLPAARAEMTVPPSE